MHPYILELMAHGFHMVSKRRRTENSTPDAVPCAPGGQLVCGCDENCELVSHPVDNDLVFCVTHASFHSCQGEDCPFQRQELEGKVCPLTGRMICRQNICDTYDPYDPIAQQVERVVPNPKALMTNRERASHNFIKNRESYEEVYTLLVDCARTRDSFFSDIAHDVTNLMCFFYSLPEYLKSSKSTPPKWVAAMILVAMATPGGYFEHGYCIVPQCDYLVGLAKNNAGWDNGTDFVSRCKTVGADKNNTKKPLLKRASSKGKRATGVWGVFCDLIRASSRVDITKYLEKWPATRVQHIVSDPMGKPAWRDSLVQQLKTEAQ